MISIAGKSIIGFFLLFTTFTTFAQNNEDIGRLSTVSTAVPFLRITPDARSGAMGDVGIGLSPDANSQYYNAAKIPFSDKDLGLALSYSPWLRSLGISDIFIANMAAYYKIGALQSISMSLKYFNLGNITFTSQTGDFIREFKPREFAIDVAYARRLSDNFGMGLSLRYIYSNLASGTNLDGQLIKAGHAVGADISFYYQKPLTIGKNDMEGTVTFGTTLSNIGSKISYSNDAINQDFIPANLGIGAGFSMKPNELHSIGFYFDINKLLVPSPIDTDLDNDGIIDPDFDENNNGVPDYKEKSPIGALFSSFGDAEGGFKEEMREINLSTGAEYGYNDLFFLRLGYFYEHPTKGNRKYFTAGLGVKYNVFGLDFSYLVPTSNERNPLDNTLRFTLKFDFADLGGKAKAEEEELFSE
jgi:hypothetical protein